MKRRRLLLLLGAVAVLLVPAGSQAVEQETFAFPSPTSTFVTDGAYKDGSIICCFLSASEGHSVAETFNTELAFVTGATLNLHVPQNGLGSGQTVDWVLSINGTDVGTFQVLAGETGPKTVSVSFPPIEGPSYAVKIRVTNDVPLGGGAHSLTYNGSDPRSVELTRPNTCDDTENPNVDEDGLASEPIHGAVEPLTGPLGTTVHEVNCTVIVELGL